MFNLSETENLLRILLVDDDKDHLMLFKLVLEDGGYSVDAYTDPVAALLKFRPDYYDLAGTRLHYAGSKWPRIIQTN